MQQSVVQKVAVWCTSLLENLKPVYGKRTESLPQKPLLRKFSEQKPPVTEVSDSGNPQSIVKKSIVKESIVKESIEDSPLPPKGEDCENDGESLSVETAEDEPNDGSSSKTRKPRKSRKHKSTGVLTKEQQERFEKFWQAYPNKKSPGQAEITFAKFDPDDDIPQYLAKC